MFVRLSNFGRLGVVHDTVGQALPSGVWSDALNIRFDGVEMQKMLEPDIFASWDFETNGRPVWFQQWADGLTTYLAVATGSALWLYYDNGLDQAWVDVSRPKGYNTDGVWHSFAWGDTCIFNNGIDPPQIYSPDKARFRNLPNWGRISTADDLLNNTGPSKKVTAACVKLVPFKTFLVAVGVTEGGLYNPNKIWWSGTTNRAGLDGSPDWDYVNPGSLSGQIIVDPEGGAIRNAVQLNEQIIIYSDVSSTAMSFVGGTLVMQFRRLFNKGACSIHSVAEFNNQHFCVAQDQIYIHDGNRVQLIAKDRVEEEFYKRIGKGGRFGGGEVPWEALHVVKNPDRKEIIISFTDPAFGTPPPPASCTPVAITQQPVDGNAGGGSVTFTVEASGTEPITYQWFENTELMVGETNRTLTVPDTSTSTYYVVLNNPCGSAQSNTVKVAASCVPSVVSLQPTDQPAGSGSVTFTIEVAGTEPITIQWQQDTGGDNNFSDMAGEVNKTLTVADTSTNQYRANVSNACGSATSNVVKILTESVEVVATGVQFQGYHAGEGLVYVAPDGTIAFNHQGYGSIQVSDTAGLNFKTKSVARSYNAGYPINHIAYDPLNSRWWALVYRTQIRASGFTYSDNNWDYAETDPQGTTSIWWGGGTGGTQDIFNSYSHAFWVGQQGGSDPGTMHHWAAHESNDSRFLYYWPRPPLSISDPPVLTDGPEDPAGNFTALYIPTESASAWIHYSSDQMTKRVMTVWGGEGTADNIAFWTKQLIVPVEVTEIKDVFSDGNGRVCAFDGVGTARFWSSGGKDTADSNIGYSEFFDNDGVAPPSGTNGLYEFDRPVKSPVFGYGAGGWVCGAIDGADQSTMCFVGTNITGTKTVTFPFPLVDGLNKQLLYDTARGRWLLATQIDDGIQPAGAETMMLYAINVSGVQGGNW